MHRDVLKEVENFAREFGLSDHRVGMILARNGRLLERLRRPSCRVWPETVAKILANVDRERSRRRLSAGSSGPEIRRTPDTRRGAA